MKAGTIFFLYCWSTNKQALSSWHRITLNMVLTKLTKEYMFILPLKTDLPYDVPQTFKQGKGDLLKALGTAMGKQSPWQCLSDFPFYCDFFLRQEKS